MDSKTKPSNLVLNLIFGMAFLISFSGYSQDYNTLGLRLAFNSSNIFSDVPNQTNKKRDFAVAGFYKMHITEEIIYFQPELGFSRKGSNMVFDDIDYDLSLNYIDVPLVFSIGQKNISFVELGGYFSYLIHADVNNKNVLALDTNDINRLDYGLVLGLNGNYENFAIGVRYYYGLGDIPKKSMQNLLGERARNSVFQVYVTYTFL